MHIHSTGKPCYLQEKQFSPGEIPMLGKAMWSFRLSVLVTLNLPIFLYPSVTMDSVITGFKSMHYILIMYQNYIPGKLPDCYFHSFKNFFPIR